MTEVLLPVLCIIQEPIRSPGTSMAHIKAVPRYTLPLKRNIIDMFEKAKITISLTYLIGPATSVIAIYPKPRTNHTKVIPASIKPIFQCFNKELDCPGIAEDDFSKLTLLNNTVPFP